MLRLLSTRHTGLHPEERKIPSSFETSLRDPQDEGILRVTKDAATAIAARGAQPKKNTATTAVKMTMPPAIRPRAAP